MTTFKCNVCGGELEVRPGETTAQCPYCGSRQTLPAAFKRESGPSSGRGTSRKEETSSPSVRKKPAESNFVKKSTELKSQIAALTDTVKKDKEKVSRLEDELAKINAKNPEAALKREKITKTVSPILLTVAIIGSIAGLVFLELGEMELLAAGIVCLFISLNFLVAFIAILFSKWKKGATEPAEKMLEEKKRVSSALESAKQEVEKHRSELQAKQEELKLLILGV